MRNLSNSIQNLMQNIDRINFSTVTPHMKFFEVMGKLKSFVYIYFLNAQNTNNSRYIVLHITFIFPPIKLWKTLFLNSSDGYHKLGCLLFYYYFLLLATEISQISWLFFIPFATKSIISVVESKNNITSDQGWFLLWLYNLQIFKRELL